MENDDVFSPILGRRKILQGAGVLSLLSLVRLGSGSKLADVADVAGVAGAAHVIGGPRADADLDVSDLIDTDALQSMCVLTPGETEGPYYLNLNLLRQNITEGQAGLQTRLYVTVVSAATCAPIPNASVDIWHNNALGVYSGFANQSTQGQTWLRGVQMTDANGLAVFDTIFPGWYQGRTTHVHVKVRPTPTTVLTTQMYFVQSLSNRIHVRGVYAPHGLNPTKNVSDGLYLPETLMTTIGVTPGIGLQQALTIGVA